MKTRLLCFPKGRDYLAGVKKDGGLEEEKGEKGRNGHGRNSGLIQYYKSILIETWEYRRQASLETITG